MRIECRERVVWSVALEFYDRILQNISSDDLPEGRRDRGFGTALNESEIEAIARNRDPIIGRAAPERKLRPGLSTERVENQLDAA